MSLPISTSLISYFSSHISPGSNFYTPGLERFTLKLYHKWLNTKVYEYKQAYLEIKRQTRRRIIAEKKEMWDRKCQEINVSRGWKVY
jgi:hypothetical protein